MKHKPIRVDWDDLEAAFTGKRGDLPYFLDLVTGEVVLEGEGEGDADDEGEDLEEALEADAVVRGDSARISIEPPGPEDELDWMHAFVSAAEDLPDGAAAALADALETEAPDEAFREALRDLPEARDQWFLYRLDRVHEWIEVWLAENDVVPADPPPWN